MSKTTEKTTKSRPYPSEKSLQNLIQNQPGVTHERIVENCRKANLASQEARRRRKTLRTVLQDLMVLEPTEKEIKRLLREAGLPSTNENAIGLAAVNRAILGDIEAARFVRDSMGEKPTENMQLGVYNTPVKALDMTKLSDAELEAIADQIDADD